MLQVYYGRENVNKDQFIFENIKGNTFLIVPDQFTLQGEKDAFFYLKKAGFLDIEVMSFSRLGHRIIEELGSPREKMIDKQGRHMLLASILKKEGKNLELYQGYEGNAQFIDMVNNFISEMKQYDTSPERLAEIYGEMDGESYLFRKLKDMETIFRKYEEAILGKYVDSEDFVDFYGTQIEKSTYLKGKDIWVYGFDYLTPKNIFILQRLLAYGLSIHVVLTGTRREEDIFSLSKRMVSLLKNMAMEVGVSFREEEIGEKYRLRRSEGLSHIERELFHIPGEEKSCPEVTFTRASNFYSEGKTAAQEIRRLVREKGLKYNEISLICNDLGVRGDIYKRVFSQYDIPLFIDQKRDILHNPAVTYIGALLDGIIQGYRREEVFKILKTGLTDLSDDQVELLEDYATEFNITGKRWKEPFSKGIDKYGQERVDFMESLRGKALDKIILFSENFKEGKTVKEKVVSLYGFLNEGEEIPRKLEEIIDRQLELGLVELAEESAQVWNISVKILEQLVEILGEESISMKDFRLLLASGFEAVEIGVLPPTVDALIMGTMQRTRSGRVKALLILGGNEGVLPQTPLSNGILSEEEKQFLQDREVEICKLDGLQNKEENLAIYRHISRAEESIWISYSLSDEEGNGLKPSSFFNQFKTITKGEEVKDIDSAKDALEYIGGQDSTLEYIGKAMVTEQWEEPLLDAFFWYRENQPEKIRVLERGLAFSNHLDALEKNQVKELFQRKDAYSFSPSRLEKYSKCPFSHFVSYGLRPEEKREYKVGSLDLGTLAHDCFMFLGERLSKEGQEITAEESLWMTISKEDCLILVEEILEEEMKGYRDGLILEDAGERYRGKRIVELCKDTVWAMISQVRKGKISSMAFEASFGRDKEIRPIIVPVDMEDTKEQVYIEGKIDRVDFLPEDYVVVVDYKSGQDQYSREDAIAGWKLQLFIYLRSVATGEKKPAGTFYFHIKQPEIEVKGKSLEEMLEKIDETIQDKFRMNGVMVDTPSVVDSLDKDFSEKSLVIPVKVSGKEGKKEYKAIGGAEKVLSPPDFEQLLEEVKGTVDDLCHQLLHGNIDIAPKKKKDASACTYCPYKGICKFDITFKGCEYVKM